MLTRRLALAASAALAAPAIHAQPVAGGRPVRVIVPFPPGGAVDITSRLLADKLGQCWASRLLSKTALALVA